MHKHEMRKAVTNHFGLWLERMRTSRRLTQAAVGAVVKRDQTTVGRWEKGSGGMNISDVEALGDYFDDREGAIKAFEEDRRSRSNEDSDATDSQDLDFSRIPEDEQELLKRYRGLNPRAKTKVLSVLDLFEESVTITGEEDEDELHSRTDGS